MTNSLPVVAKFEKVSFDTFLDIFTPMWIAMEKNRLEIPDGESFGYDKADLIKSARTVYDNIKLPRRLSPDSASYEFFFPFGYTEIGPGDSIVVPTGIKVKLNPGWVLGAFTRTSLGLNFRLQLDDSVSIIQPEHYNNSTNEGHIIFKLTNDSKIETAICGLNIMDPFVQGILLPFGLAKDDRPLSLDDVPPEDDTSIDSAAQDKENK